MHLVQKFKDYIFQLLTFATWIQWEMGLGMWISPILIYVLLVIFMIIISAIRNSIFEVSLFFFWHFLLFKYSCLHFPPALSLTHPPHLPPYILPSLALFMGPLSCSLMTLPFLSLVSPPFSPLVTVSLFFTSMPLVLFCLLVFNFFFLHPFISFSQATRYHF